MLQKGIGHIERSSPLGGEKGTHCLLAGHRGLPDAELLTRLGEMKEGELFYIETSRDRYTYIQKDRQLVSLITCTPYGINTHRLVVTGERLEEEK